MNAYKIQGRGKVSEEVSFKVTHSGQTAEELEREAKHRETVKQSKQKMIQRVHTNAVVASEKENVQIKPKSDITFT